METFNFKPIAFVNSPYKQKFAIPRQPNLVSEAQGQIVFELPFSDSNLFREIRQFSHIWVIFAFHACIAEGWSPLVHPPRLGGKEKVGVFASRSTHRPNPIGMSVVKLEDIQQKGNVLSLAVSGLDLLDGTPVLDIKPYIPYADSIEHAEAGYAKDKPLSPMDVEFSDAAQEQLMQLEEQYSSLRQFIISVLEQDPRPAYKRNKNDDKQYGMNLYDLNIKWQVKQDCIRVLQIESPDKCEPLNQG